MKRLVILLMLPLIVIFAGYGSLKADNAVFRDIDHSFAKSEILELYNKHVIDGSGPGVFEPTKAVSRAEFVKMLAGIMQLEPVHNSIPAFQDVSLSDWYYGWVYAAVDLGIVDGKSENSFAPNETITREEAAAILVRALKQSNPAPDGYSYQDKASVSSWALPYVDAVSKAGLMEGYDQSFYPLKNLTREEAAVILKRVSDKLQPGTPVTPSIQIGWQYEGTTSEFKERILKSNVNVISPRWFFLEKDGKISSFADVELVKWAHDNQKKVWALVGNHFDPETTHLFLTTGKQDALLELTNVASKYELDGLNLDFENVNPDDRDLLTSFAEELGSRLRAAGKVLSIDVPPDLQTDWSQPYDYAALSKKADYLVIMDYEEHWQGTDKIGSVSSLPWFVDGLQRIIKQTASSNIIVGAPLYTRDWQVAAGKTDSLDWTLQEQERRYPYFSNITWDASVGQYAAAYTVNGQAHYVWLEDSRSLSLKYLHALQHNVAGFAYWYVGSETDDIWTALRNSERWYHLSF